jgi:hypothetical protein
MCVLAFATALAIGSMVTAAEAKGSHGGRGGHGGGHAVSHGFSGGGGRGLSIRSGSIGRGFHVGRGFRHGHRFHRFRGGYYPYYYSGYRGCYRWRRILTPYGWHVRRINVCHWRRHHRLYWY